MCVSVRGGECVCDRERERDTDRDRESDPITSLQAESGSPPCGGNVYRLVIVHTAVV